MISVQDAFSILKKNLPITQEIEYSLAKANKHILADSINSPINMPPFRQSAMDGFALCLHESLEYKILGEIKAGDTHRVALKPGQAVKIFTGAAVPDSARAVIQIEKVEVIDTILHLDENPIIGTNVRPVGEQISEGDLALEKGVAINAAAIGFLAGLGITSVKVYKKPTIGIIVTGNELVKPGNPLEYGKVYESNGLMLQTALKDSFFEEVALYEVNDDFENTKDTLKNALDNNDIILVSGGISVGDYDFVAQALKELEVETLFYKVNQKPGKPLFAGKIKDKLVFALPGNPAACLTCFYVYVLPTIAMISGCKTSYNATFKKSLSHDYSVNNTRCQFLKASLIDQEVTILSHQNSSMLNTFSVANGLVYVPNGIYEIPLGEKVDFYPF